MPNSLNRIYVGFGGSGAKSILAFAEKLAQHHEWGRQSEVSYAFILVDTDKNDLKKYETKIRNCLGFLGVDPILSVIRTSESVTSFGRFVSTKLVEAGHHDGIKKHWPYSPAEPPIPFTAEHFTGSPEDGAGQCPLVAMFLAWANMDKVQAEIKNVIERLQRRNTLADGRQSRTVNVSLISGLAGGTGRGCWWMLSFKILETLTSLGLPCQPVGYFFDSSVFQEVGNTDQGQATKLKVNSLTGFSELVALLRNETSKPPYNLSLCNLMRPGDAASDHINVNRVVRRPDGQELPGVHGQSPVQQAFVVFRGGKAGALGSPESYYKVVANAMFVRLVSDVASRIVNQAKFGGIGGASITIPVSRIRSYVKQYLHKFLPLQIARGSDLETMDRWTKLLTKPLHVSKPFTYQPKADGALLERVLHGVMAQNHPRIRHLTEALDPKSRDYERAKEECKRLDSWAESKEGQAQVRQIALRVVLEAFWGQQSGPEVVGTGGLLRAIGTLDKLSPSEWKALYEPEGVDGAVNPISTAFRHAISKPKLQITLDNGQAEQIDLSGFTAKAELAQRLAQSLQDTVSQLPLPPSGSDPSAVGSQRSLELFERARKGLFSSGVDANETGEIIQAATNRVRVRCMAAVKEVLERELNRAADELISLSRQLKKVVEALREHAKHHAEELKAMREELFWTAEDFSRTVSAGGEARYRGDILAEQVLQPVDNEAALEEALGQRMRSGDNERFEDGLSDFTQKLATWVRSWNPRSDESERDRELRRLVDRSIDGLREELVLGHDFYVKHFGFFNVVRDLLMVWGTEFKRCAGSDADMQRLKQSFRIQFGFDYPFDRYGPEQPQGNDLEALARKACQHMAVELGNRCDVLFDAPRSGNTLATDDVVQVVAPSGAEFHQSFGDETELLAREKGRFKKAGSFDILCLTDKEGVDPFTMVAYAQENFPSWNSEDQPDGLDQVTSLGYHSDPSITEWLEACENPRNKSYFDFMDLPNATNVFGLGYTSRVFVENEHLKKLRWKPWVKAGAEAIDRAESFMLDVIVYALMDEPNSESGSALRRVNDTEGWSMPVIEVARNEGKSWIFTRSAFRNHLGAWSANDPTFRAGVQFSSIGKLLKYFESGLPHPGVAALAAEAAHYLGEVLPQHSESVSVDGVVREMLRQVARLLEDESAAATGHTQDEHRKLYGRLLKRIDALSNLGGAAALAMHFERRGRP